MSLATMYFHVARGLYPTLEQKLEVFMMDVIGQTIYNVNHILQVYLSFEQLQQHSKRHNFRMEGNEDIDGSSFQAKQGQYRKFRSVKRKKRRGFHRERKRRHLESVGNAENASSSNNSTQTPTLNSKGLRPRLINYKI